MPPTQPFLISSLARDLAEFKTLPPNIQAFALLRRLAAIFPAPKTFHRANLDLPAYGKPDSIGLCAGWPDQDRGTGNAYVLRNPWRFLIKEDLIAEAGSGPGNYELTDEGWELVNSGRNTALPDQALTAALRFLHPDLQDYGHYFREKKLKEAVRAGFTRIENRLNEIRDKSSNSSIKTVKGVDLPHKLFDASELAFPFANLAAADPRSREAYASNLKGLLKAGIGWFRNSFDHEPHNLPDPTEAEALELLFVASYMLRIIDKSVSP